MLSSDPLTRKMGGVGLRYRLMMEHLSRKMEVLAWAPEALEGLPEDIVRWNGKSLAGVDLVLSPPMAFLAFPMLLASDVFLVVDLIDPLIFENSFLYPGDELRLKAYSNLLLLGLWRGDHFVVAHRHQRDLWMGTMLATRRMDAGSLARDSLCASLFTEFPTPGPDGDAPRNAARRDTILWWGGLWDWMDPMTLLESFAMMKSDDPSRLLFIGTRHPSGFVPMSRVARTLQKEAQKGAPTGKSIEIMEWVPYEDRGEHFQRTVVGVSLHRDTVESGYAYRTRLLDLLWAGIPIVVTRGEYLGDLAVNSGAALSVPPGSASAVADAIRKIWTSPQLASAMSEAGQKLARALSWASRAPAFCDRLQEVRKQGLVLRRPHPKVVYRQYREVRADFKRIGSLLHRFKTAVRREGFRGLFREG